MRTSEQIKTEIADKFGFFPSFFEPAQHNPQVLENLWQQTLCAYINNPLPELFKEKLFTYLSRYCAIPYCIICHSCSLHQFGMKAPEVLALLEAPTPNAIDIELQLSAIAVQQSPLTVLPSNCALEDSLLYCSTFIFLEPASAERCRYEMRRILGAVNYQHLVVFLSYVKTSHNWVEAYPEIAYEADQRVQNHLNALLEDEPRLAEFLGNYGERVKREHQSREEQMLVELLESKRKEEEARMLQSTTQAISESQDFHSALGVTLRQIGEFAGWNFGEAWIPHPNKAALVCSPAWYATNSGLEQFRRASEGFEFSLGVGLPGRIWASKQIEWQQDVSTMPETTFFRAQTARECGLRTALGIPLISGEQVLAVLVFYMFESHEQDERLVELISGLTQSGAVIQRKQAESALQKAHDELEIRVQERTAELKKAAEELRTEITLRQLAESELRANEEQFRATFSQAAVGIAHLATDGRWLLVNQKLGDILGYTPQELQARTFQAIITHPDDQDTDLDYVRRILETENQTYSVEKRYIRKDTDQVWINLTVSLGRDALGEAKYFIAVVEDISERKQAEEALWQSAVQFCQQANQLEQALHELQQTQAQLIQTEKMSSLGQMVAGIAHEINNPVNFIYGNLKYTDEYIQDLLNLVQLYQQQYPHPAAAIQTQIQDIDLEFIASDLPKMLDSMKIGAERIRQLVVSLRNFSRLDQVEVKQVDLHEGIDNTLLILNHQLKFGITVSKQYGDLPLVECYPAQLNQVFMNLLSNAIDALNESPSPPDKQIVIQTQAIAPNQIKVLIRDNGPGIPSAIKDKIFDPFFTTKPVGKGTGLGLAICYQIIEKHYGQISVSSHPSQGTEFVITLPVKQ